TANGITRVTTKRQRKQFINFPYSHYQNDRYWIAPLKLEQKELLDTDKNPFFNNADIELFLYKQNDEIHGRIAAVDDQRFNDYHDTATGFFGFFESIDDQQVADKLIEAASDWLRDRGLTDVLGPANPGMMDEVGMLVDGFDYYPSILMPYNKSYYDNLLKNAGFEKEMDLYAFRVTQD